MDHFLILFRLDGMEIGEEELSSLSWHLVRMSIEVKAARVELGT